MHGCTRREFIAQLCAVGATACAVRPFTRDPVRLSETWHERMRPLMATYVSVAIMHNDREAALGILDRCFTYIERVISHLSSWDDTSLVSKFNRQRKLCKNEISSEAARLFELASIVSKATAGRFNLLISPLTFLWRAARDASSTPKPYEIQKALAAVQGSALATSDQAAAILGNGAIDVGGLGKGLIADLACEYLRLHGVKTARVACSGDIRFQGDGPWDVEVPDPRKGKLLRTVSVRGSMAISTSADTENRWESGGEVYHHLIDPTTGMPGRINHQITIVAPTCGEADAFASGLFFLPARNALKIAKSRGYSALIVDADHNITG